MDQEFGVSTLVEEEFEQRRQVRPGGWWLGGGAGRHCCPWCRDPEAGQARTPEWRGLPPPFQDLYSARDLQGLTVEHAIESIILKDKGVLQEKEGVLVNVKLVEQDRALWRKKPVLLPYAEDESVEDLSQ